MDNVTKKKDISIVLGGSAGQGLQTVEKIIAMFFQQEGIHVFSTSEYMSRVRGGSNSVEMRIGEIPRKAFVKKIDIAFLLDEASFERLAYRFDEETIIIVDPLFVKEKIKAEKNIFFIPLEETADLVGGKVFMNTIVAGMILAIFNIDNKKFLSYLKNIFAKKGEDIVEKNILAATKGRILGEKVRSELEETTFSFEKKNEKKNTMFLNGSEGIALGSLAGGCNFISSYPMSPATAVLTLMAEYSQKIPLAVEQVEDEITAINMALGAWFGGARALVTTSGGGFALMAESMSLSGMTESPVVIHLAQRPGPATGLPTRTEQGDLDFALHTGHGTFPRAILTPGTPEECFVCGKKAFDLADKYQIPVIVMTDTFLLDSRYESNAEIFSFEQKPQKYFIETESSYKRYAFTSDGLSPRGIPGFGDGFVHVDSDEHDEDGRIIEDEEMRNRMMEKRMYRLELLKKDVLDPVYKGSNHDAFLVIGWGSTYGVISEALESLQNNHIGYLHVNQVYPLGEEIQRRILSAEKIIIIENNMTGQFADILFKEVERKPDHLIVKYDGSPYSVEELRRYLEDIVN
ncbi:MAG: 2-oxoacid:acceptor oxidoreductase subunit alpha [Candidatus Moraniibacteriota bacterium]|nr:MAG: 2-oxoacid:acceptor oxidoreductase subunit alpha [Candidatus Moranbacteria bacterium]